MRRNSDAPKGVKRARVERSQPTTRRTPCTEGTAVGKIRVGIFAERDGGGQKDGGQAPRGSDSKVVSATFNTLL